MEEVKTESDKNLKVFGADEINVLAPFDKGGATDQGDDTMMFEQNN